MFMGHHFRLSVKNDSNLIVLKSMRCIKNVHDNTVARYVQSMVNTKLHFGSLTTTSKFYILFHVNIDGSGQWVWVNYHTQLIDISACVSHHACNTSIR